MGLTNTYNPCVALLSTLPSNKLNVMRNADQFGQIRWRLSPITFCEIKGMITTCQINQNKQEKITEKNN